MNPWIQYVPGGFVESGGLRHVGCKEKRDFRDVVKESAGSKIR